MNGQAALCENAEFDSRGGGKEVLKTEGYALGYMKDGEEKIFGDEAKTENTEAKESPELKSVKEMMDKGLFSTDGNSDLLWGLLILLLVFGGKSRDELSEYWRGRYDALKEMIECGGEDTK